MKRCPWLVYEAGDRWRRGLRRFADSRVDVRSATIGEIRALAVSVRPLVITWELPRESEAGLQAVRAIAAISKATSPPLQLIVFPAESTPDPGLAWLLRQLGATHILRHVEQLPAVVRLVDRYLGSI